MRYKLYLFGFCVLLNFLSRAQTSKIDSLKAIIALNRQDEETARNMNFLSFEYVRTDIEEAKKYLWKAKYLGELLGNSRTLSASYSQLTSIYQNQAEIDSAEIYLSRLKKLALEASGSNANIVKVNYYSTAGLFFKKSGNLKEALAYFIKAHETAINNNDLVSASGQAINIGNSYLGLSDFNSALDFYLKALKGFEQTKNIKGQSFCFQNIGECYIELNRYESAIEYIHKSILLKREMMDKRGLGNAEQSLGRIYLGVGDYKKSLAHYEKALTIVRELKLSTEEVKINLNLGNVFALKNEPDVAFGYYKKSKELAKRLGDSSSVIAANLGMLGLQNAPSKTADAEKNALLNIQVLKETGAIGKEASGYKNIAEYYTNLKQYDKALDYTNRYYALIDSIKNNEIQAQFKQIEEEYNKGNNEKQIELLQKDQLINSEKLKQQQFLLLLSGLVIVFISLGIWMLIYRNKLRQRMKEVELRNQIASDLHDEVGSSLSSIFMLSKMAMNTTDDSQHKILTTVSDNAHETMDKMSDIVWMLKPSENSGVDLKDRMERFIHDMCSSRTISYTFSADKLETLKLTTAQNKNLYLIFKEAVNNAIKYSKTAKLLVRIWTQDKRFNMMIADEGSGFDEQNIERGNGLDNMKIRAKELKGELTIDSILEKGTEIRLSFPLSLK